MREVRLLDATGEFVRSLNEDEAAKLISDKQATMRVGGRRPVLVLTEQLTVSDLESTSSTHGSVFEPVKTTYKESHGGHTVVMLKRATPDGLQKWDNDLTFDELRRGQIVSATTRHRLALERAERARVQKVREPLAA